MFGSHWIWVVLTAYIVCSGNRGRGDVVHKSAIRVIGAACGTLAPNGSFGAAAARGCHVDCPYLCRDSDLPCGCDRSSTLFGPSASQQRWRFSTAILAKAVQVSWGPGSKRSFLGLPLEPRPRGLFSLCGAPTSYDSIKNTYLGLTAAYLADLGGGEAKLNRLQSGIARSGNGFDG